MIRLTLPAILLASLSLVPQAQAQFIISTATGTFEPSFRGDANTTWFGWGPGSFDGATDNELIDNPAVTIGGGGLDGTLNQVGTADIISSGNNIYNGFSADENLTLTIPIDGTVGTGFTTIIIQGRMAAPQGAYATLPVFSDLAGASPTVVSGVDSNNFGQFWVKYEIAGNASSYSPNIFLQGFTHISIGELVVDTQWSSTGYASDTAAVPEPSAFAFLACGGLLALGRRLRRGSR